jgi:PAS domain S-box-containing protein
MNKLPFPRLARRPDWGAIQIATLYLLLGGLWILFSDQVAARFAVNAKMFAVISLYKGWGYVLVTALILYWLIQRYTGRLKQSEEDYELLAENITDVIWVLDLATNRFRYMSPSVKRLSGFSAQEVLAQDVAASITTDPAHYFEKILPERIQEFQADRPRTYTDEVEQLRNDGTTVWTEMTTRFVVNKINGHLEMYGASRDIGERKRVEAEVRLWADAFEGCAHGIAIGDVHTNRIVVCNPAFASLHKRRVEDVIGSAILSLYAPADHEHVRRNVQKADQIGHCRFEAEMIRRDGSTFPVQMDLVSVLGDEGELLYRVATAQDISERKRAEQELQESEERYRIVSELTSDYAYKDRVEADGSIVPEWITDSFARITGYTLREAQTPGFWEGLIYPEDLPVLKRHMQKFLSGQKSFEEMRVKTKRGEVRWLRDFANPVWDEKQGRVVNLYGAVQDVTEYKRTEENLRRFELLSEHSRDIILFIGNKDGRILEANAAALQTYGYSRAELLSLTVRDLRAGDTSDVANQMAQAEAGGILFETVHRRRDGSTFPVEVSSQGANIGSTRILISIVRDITERKRVEQALYLKDELLRLTSEMAKVGGWEFDAETGKGTWTDEVARIHDLEPDQETNVEIGLSFYSGGSREKVEQAVKEAVELARPYDLELEMITAKSAHKWVRTMGLPVVQDGKVIKVQGIFQDITERKQIESALQAAHAELERKVQERTSALSEANALLQALMDHMPEQIYFKDTQSRFIRNSRSQANLLGLNDPSEVVGKTDFDFFPHAAQAYTEEQEVMRSGKPLVDFEEWVVWPTGREMWVSTTKVPLRNAEGEIIGIFGISHDITGRKRAEQAIRQLNTSLERKAEELQAANKELEAFSYSVSHDLRAPLRAIDGYTRILVEDYEEKFDAEGRRICGVISAEARRMGQLIDDLLAFSRLGRKEMFTSRIDMKALAISVFDELAKEPERERIDFQIGKLPGTKGDLSLMHQVWVNLLSNALKFTSKKERATIEVGSKQTRDENIYFVRDTGAGFDMEYANKLFGVFQRLHGETEFEGTGVGLAIVQRIIRRHGGRVWAEGQEGEGATFYFALPRKENHS